MMKSSAVMMEMYSAGFTNVYPLKRKNAETAVAEVMSEMLTPTVRKHHLAQVWYDTSYMAWCLSEAVAVGDWSAEEAFPSEFVSPSREFPSVDQLMRFLRMRVFHFAQTHPFCGN